MLIEYQTTTGKLMTENGAQATDVIKVLRLPVTVINNEKQNLIWSLRVSIHVL